MRLLLDTNIIVDVISGRDGCAESLGILRLCEAGRAEGHATAVTVNDVMYILRKHISPSNVREAVQTLLSILDVADVLGSDVESAFASPMADFEDALQASCAGRIHADFIVTRNIKDFKASKVPALLPEDAMKLLQ
jgi:predicted nucleic acid-binding protein